MLYATKSYNRVGSYLIQSRVQSDCFFFQRVSNNFQDISFEASVVCDFKWYCVLSETPCTRISGIFSRKHCIAFRNITEK